MNDMWDRLNKKHYRRMRRRHARLWDFVERYIQDNHVKSIVEVGCGLDPNVEFLVDEYLGIDLNPRTNAFHVDFTKMDVKKLPCPDLLLACGVIEHCEDYNEFLSQVKLINAKYSIVSFFGGPFKRIVKGQWKSVLYHIYPRKMLAGVIAKCGVEGELIKLWKTDTVLIIKGE